MVRGVGRDAQHAGPRQHRRWVRPARVPAELVSVPGVVLPRLVVQELDRFKVARRQLQKVAHPAIELANEGLSDAARAVAIGHGHVARGAR